MNKKTKFLLGIFSILIFVFTFLYSANEVFAGRWGLDDVADTSGYSKTEGNLVVAAGTVVNVALSLVGFIFFGMILYGGIRWMISRGNDELKQKAKDAIINAVIGLVIVVSAYAISTFVLDKIMTNYYTEGVVTVDDVECLTDSDCLGSDYCSSDNICVSGGAVDANGCCTFYIGGDYKECSTSLQSACTGSGYEWNQAKCIQEGSIPLQQSCHY